MTDDTDCCGCFTDEVQQQPQVGQDSGLLLIGLVAVGLIALSER